MRLLKLLLVTGLLTALLLPFGTALAAPSSPEDNLMPRYFPETGFWVQGPFRQYWETHGGLYIQGYPITGVFWQDNMWVQYFERARFEYHPENAGTPYAVLLTRVGAIETANRGNEAPFQPLAPFTNSNDHTYFPETQHALSYGFKTFWNDNEGLQNFGYPLSEEFTETNPPPPAGDGQAHTVQYFERSRFEYHPEYKGTQYEVLLGLLGRTYLDQRGAPADAVARQDPNMPPTDPITGRHYGPHAGAGFNVYLRGDVDGASFNDQTLSKVTEAGFGWVHFQLAWNGMEPGPGAFDPSGPDRIINQVAAKGLKILVSVVGPAPNWMNANGVPSDTGQYQALTQYLANRYAGKVQAWEIWNEENLAGMLGSSVDIGQYVNLLKAGYQGIKAGDPNAIVVFGALTPNGVNDPSIAIDDVQYLKQIYAYNGGEIKNYFDALGAHPGSNANPPDAMWPNNPGPGPGWTTDGSFYFRRIEQLRQVMIDNGDAAKQIWLTEFGWTTANQAPGYEYGAQNSPQDQADYLVRAFQIGQTEWPWIGPMFVWNLNYSVVAPASDEKSPWAVLNPDWSPRPAYTALTNMPK